MCSLKLGVLCIIDELDQLVRVQLCVRVLVAKLSEANDHAIGRRVEVLGYDKIYCLIEVPTSILGLCHDNNTMVAFNVLALHIMQRLFDLNRPREHSYTAKTC